MSQLLDSLSQTESVHPLAVPEDRAGEDDVCRVCSSNAIRILEQHLIRRSNMSQHSISCYPGGEHSGQLNERRSGEVGHPEEEYFSGQLL